MSPEQTSLDFRPKGVPRSHRRDPNTSRVAERRVAGKVAQRLARIHGALLAHGDGTYTQIAGWAGIEAHEVARRLPNAKELGLVRRLTATGLVTGGGKGHLWEAVLLSPQEVEAKLREPTHLHQARTP